MSMSATQSVWRDRSLLSRSLWDFSRVRRASSSYDETHPFRLSQNLRWIDRLDFRNSVEHTARLSGTFGPVAHKVAVGCLHAQRQRRKYTRGSTRDVLVHDNGLSRTRSIQVPATCLSAHASLCDYGQLLREHFNVSLGAILVRTSPRGMNAHHTDEQSTGIGFYR